MFYKNNVNILWAGLGRIGDAQNHSWRPDGVTGIEPVLATRKANALAAVLSKFQSYTLK